MSNELILQDHNAKKKRANAQVRKSKIKLGKIKQELE